MVQVSYPATPMPWADREDAIIVAIQRDGVVYLNHERVIFDDFQNRIRAALSAGAERRVYIKADMNSSYGKVSQVVEQIRAAGIRDIAFLVEQRQPPTARAGLQSP